MKVAFPAVSHLPSHSSSIRSLKDQTALIKKRSSLKGKSFQNVFDKVIEKKVPLKISAHAQKRLEQRGIEVSQKMWNQVENAVEKAKGKGIQQSLVVADGLMWIVNVPKSVVVTVVKNEELNNRVFTNIDGVVFN